MNKFFCQGKCLSLAVGINGQPVYLLDFAHRELSTTNSEWKLLEKSYNIYKESNRVQRRELSPEIPFNSLGNRYVILQVKIVNKRSLVIKFS